MEAIKLAILPSTCGHRGQHQDGTWGCCHTYQLSWGGSIIISSNIEIGGLAAPKAGGGPDELAKAQALLAH